jgi:hypothetical protein
VGGVPGQQPGLPQHFVTDAGTLLKGLVNFFGQQVKIIHSESFLKMVYVD